MAFDMGSAENLINDIYEAAAFPDRWPDVMDRLAHSVDAAAALLLVNSSDRWSGNWAGFVSSPQYHNAVAMFMKSDIPQRTQATPRLIAADSPGFLTNDDLFSEKEWARDPLCVDWADKWGLGHAATATVIHSPSGELMLVHLQRRDGLPSFDPNDVNLLNFFRPHLARAALLATRWRLERLRIVADALAAIGLPALIINPNSRVIAANKLIEDMTAYIKWLPNDRIALIDATADGMLRLGLAGLAEPASPSVRSFAARSGSGEHPVVAHLIPTSGQARDFFDGAFGVLALTPVTSPQAPDAAVIRGLFDLTASEARVARRIVQGLTVNEIATLHGVGRETIRSQVKSVLAKTGARHQVEVASLLSGLPKIPVVKD